MKRSFTPTSCPDSKVQWTTITNRSTFNSFDFFCANLIFKYQILISRHAVKKLSQSYKGKPVFLDYKTMDQTH